MSHSEHETDTALADVRAKVAEHGWAVLGVYPTEADPPEAVPFAYTVGLTEAGLPELFVNGLPYQVAHVMLNNTARLALAQTVELADGDFIPADEARLSVGLTIADCPTNGHLGVARALYGGKRVACLQVLWPDNEGRWPGNPGFTGRQPIGPAD